MSQPAPNQNQPSKMKKLLNGSVNDQIRSRLPQASGVNKPAPKPAAAPAAAPPVSETKPSQLKLLPAFWTIASVMSITVNIVLIVVLLFALQMLGTLQTTANDRFSGVLGGLYNNFVKMDNATIRAQVPVNATIPLKITVPVEATTQITLAQDVVIQNAHVVINTGGVDIDANATVTLPANTPLSVNLDFPLQVIDSIPVSLMVDVNIPLRNTELSQPFQGLQAVVKPYYCLVEPNAISPIDNSPICAPPALQP